MLHALPGRKAGARLPHSKTVRRPGLASMLIREYQESDLAALRAIHAAQGFDYQLPDLRNPLFVTKLVLADDAAPSVVVAQHAAPLQQPQQGTQDPVERSSRDTVGTTPSGSII